MTIEIEFDSEKEAINLAERGLSLRLAVPLFESGECKEEIDDRRDYGETRIAALGLIGGRLYFCAYTWRNGKRRIISLRKANRREINAYYQG